MSNAKEILDQAAKIIARQDIDRSLLLFFVNTARRGILRDKEIRRFRRLIEDVDHVDGVIDLAAYKVKKILIVEWVGAAVDGTTVKRYLVPTFTYRVAMENFGSLEDVGTPQAYLEMGTSLYVLPVPSDGGQINIFGEFWPSDLTDAIGSTDIMTVEIPDALTYLGAGEYFDMLGEADKAGYWRNKGIALIDQYVKQLQKADFDVADLWKRRPFGRPARTRKLEYSGFDLDDLDLGEWE
jgi:hypothetical protein